MIRISQQQMDALGQAAVEGFERRMAEHLGRCFPAACQELGPEEVRRQIRYGIARAAVWGFRAERDVAKYIDLMFTLGPDFDLDPDLPWTTPLLSDNGLPPGARIDRAVETAMAEIARRFGLAR